MESVARASPSAKAQLDAYLSMAHCDHPESGCPIAALGADVSHECASTKKAFGVALDRMLAGIAAAVPGESRAARDERLRIASSLVGALTLARATPDKELAANILAAVRAGLGHMR
jgi:TetR/AcrR family transcriptional repressor of nem operon